MKKIEGVMLSAVILTLIIGSTQVATAEKFNVDPDLNLRYEVYLQSVVRDAQGQLLSVSESTVGWVLIASFPDSVQITNFVGILFDNNVIAEKKIVTIGDIKYEKIIQNPEQQIRNLLKLCNLSWNDNCLKFYNNKRAIKTASDTQVRKKIYKSSVDSWKNYEKNLGEVFKRLPN